MGTYAEDIEFVLSELIRFAQKETRELLQHNSKLELLWATLPHPSGGGILICGAEAHNRLENMAKLAVSRSQHAGRIDPAEVLTKLKSIISHRFIGEKRNLTTKEADKAVASAVRQAAKACTDRTHLVPCHLGNIEYPNCFVIGPVKFGHQAEVFERLEPQFQEYLKSRAGESVRELPQRLLNVAREYYGSFGWVAEVTIEKCDQNTSRRLAERIVQNSIDCLHLLLGGAYSNHIRAGGPGFNIDRRGNLEINNAGEIEISNSTDWHSHHLPENWWEQLNSGQGKHLIDLIGLAINKGNDVPVPAPLSQRFLDAVAWYGEAVRDDFAASRMVKYVTAIERMLVTKKEEKLADTLANRGAAMIYLPGNNNFDQLKKCFLDVYDFRSNLVHGSVSPTSSSFWSGLVDAEELANAVLCRTLQFFGEDGLNAPKVSNAKMDSAFKRLDDWIDQNSTSFT